MIDLDHILSRIEPRGAAGYWDSPKRSAAVLAIEVGDRQQRFRQMVAAIGIAGQALVRRRQKLEQVPLDEAESEARAWCEMVLEIMHTDASSMLQASSSISGNHEINPLSPVGTAFCGVTVSIMV
jgi:hypothetical protein